MFARLISGGQTGVDRAALDAALAIGLPCGGWCPKGRRAEDGPIPDCYPLRETSSSAYLPRTRRNVRDADGTLVLTRGEARGGTALTIEFARRMRKPYLVSDLARRLRVRRVLEWAEDKGVRVLNVAGPRESENPGIYALAGRFLRRVLAGTRPLPRPAAPA